MGDQSLPAGYARLKCEHCGGTGKIKRRAGAFYSWRHDRRCRPQCSDCGGYGYIIIKPGEAAK